MSKKRNIKVIKVPLDRPPLDIPQSFPKMPTLYLELLENKDKVRQDLINKPYIPQPSPGIRGGGEGRGIRSHDLGGLDRGDRGDREDRGGGGGGDDFESKLERLIAREERGGEREERREERGERREEERVKIHNEGTDSDQGSGSGSDSDDSGSDSGASTASLDSNDSIKERRDSSDDDVSVRLKDLLNDDSSNDSDKYSRTRVPNQAWGGNRGGKERAPTLAELEARGDYTGRKEFRNVNGYTMNEQQQDDAKRELLFKFEILRKSYPSAAIPEFSIHSDYNTMKTSYETKVRELSLDSSVQSYKTYLIGGFMACEYIFGNFLGFEMQGFTQQQILQMHTYEKLLVELGEKSYVPGGSKWPVEIRLLCMILMNAAFFIVSKMIMKKTGANLMGMINGMNTANKPAAPKRPMRGPSFNLDDIPDVA